MTKQTINSALMNLEKDDILFLETYFAAANLIVFTVVTLPLLLGVCDTVQSAIGYNYDEKES